MKKTRSFNFLIELLISSLFFAFSSIICVQLFVYAHQKNELALDITKATVVAENYCEQLKIIDEEEINKYNEVSYYFDENWNISTNKEYVVNISKYDESTSNTHRLMKFNVEVIRIDDQQLLTSMKASNLLEVNK